MFVPQSKEGTLMVSALALCNEIWIGVKLILVNYGCLGLILHFWYKLRESAEQIAGERSSQERSSKGPHGRREFGKFE